MRTVADAILASIIAAAAAAATGAAWAQSATRPLPAASAPVPLTAASKAVPTRSPAITAAENAKEPGNQRPEERVIPQISIPLKSRNVSPPAATATSAPAVSRPGGVNEGAARCLAVGDADGRAACERALAASGPVKPGR